MAEPSRTQAPSAPAHVRGSLLVHLRAHVTEKHGELGWRQVGAGLPAVDQEQAGALLISGTWYPVGLWNRAWRAYVASSRCDAAAEMSALALRVANADLHTIFKITLKLASAAQIVHRADWLWRRYFDVGAVTVQEEAPNRFRVRLEAPTGEDEGPSDAVCAHGVETWMTHALVLSGAAKASVQHVRCRFTFSKFCEYRIGW